MSEATYPRAAANMSGTVQSMTSVAGEGGGGFVFTLLTDAREETLHVDLGGDAAAIVAAAWAAEVPVEVGLRAGPAPHRVEWVQVSRPPSGSRRVAGGAEGLRPEELNASNDA